MDRRSTSSAAGGRDVSMTACLIDPQRAWARRSELIVEPPATTVIMVRPAPGCDAEAAPHRRPGRRDKCARVGAPAGLRAGTRRWIGPRLGRLLAAAACSSDIWTSRQVAPRCCYKVLLSPVVRPHADRVGHPVHLRPGAQPDLRDHVEHARPPAELGLGLPAEAAICVYAPAVRYFNNDGKVATVTRLLPRSSIAADLGALVVRVDVGVLGQSAEQPDPRQRGADHGQVGHAALVRFRPASEDLMKAGSPTASPFPAPARRLARTGSSRWRAGRDRERVHISLVVVVGRPRSRVIWALTRNDLDDR